MKTRISFLIVLLMVLPLVLAACGGGDTDTAKKYIEAIADGDKDEAEKQVCDNPKDERIGTSPTQDSFDVDDLKCEEDGDNVKCTFKTDFGDENADAVKVELTFGMEDGKVCSTEGMVIDGIDILSLDTAPVEDTPAEDEAPADETTEEESAG